MSETLTHGPTGRPIYQRPWQPSVVAVGDRITGWDVSNGGWCTGTVAKVIGPIKSPDCGGYRYYLTDTGRYYGGGKPFEAVVYAETWAEGES